MRILLLLSAFFWSGCCAFTSQDCGCKPPDPVLSDEVKKWITPYEYATHWVFESDTGIRDSLRVERFSDTEFCGGDECGSNCEIETTLLSSVRDTTLKLSLTATQNQILRIFNPDHPESEHSAGLNTSNNLSFSNNEVSIAALFEDYIWDGQPTTVIEIKCRNDNDCNAFTMKRIVVSKSFGLIEFATADNQVWKKVN